MTQQIKIIGTLIAVAFLLIVGIVLRYTGAADVTTTAEIVNEPPTVDTINFASEAFGTGVYNPIGFTPLLGTDSKLHITGIVADANGAQDIATTSVAFYRSALDNTCTADKNNCYHLLSCDLATSTISDTEIQYNCPLDIAFWVDATDTGGRFPLQHWVAKVATSDQAAESHNLDATITMNSLLAVNIPDDINYGTRDLGEKSTIENNVETPIQQRGNSRADIEVSGNDMSCSVTGFIPVQNQRWANADVDYGSIANTPLSTTDTRVGFDIFYRDNDAAELYKTLYWNIGIPDTGVKGICAGTNTIRVIALGASVWSGENVVFNSESRTLSGAAIAEGTLWMWGNNAFGQLGLGDQVHRSIPTQIGTATDWKQVSANGNHALAIKTNGELYAWGYNFNGQLGLGDTNDRLVPTRVGTDTDWEYVGAGGTHTLAIKTDGSLWATGLNSSGQLGFGDTTQRTTFTRVGSANDWSTVRSSSVHTLAIKTDGTLYAWGSNVNGRTGIGLTSGNTLSPTQVGSANNWTHIRVGTGFSVALASTTLYTWGNNTFGELALGDTTQRATPTLVSGQWSTVEASSVHMHALDTSGFLYATGRNAFGQLGLGDYGADRLTFTQVGTKTWSHIAPGNGSAYGRTTDGTYYAWGSNDVGQLGIGTNQSRNAFTKFTVNNWKQVSAKSNVAHASAVKNDGTLWSWGLGEDGRLGLGDENQYFSPTQVGTDTDWNYTNAGNLSGYAIKTNGTLWSWGGNVAGQLGLGDTNERLNPVQVGTDTNWKDVRGGASFAVGLRTDGTLYGWGSNNAGRTGLGITSGTTLTPTQIGTATDWQSLAVGNAYACAIKTNGTLWCWGLNTSSQLGLGDTTSRTTPTQVGIDTNWESVAAGSIATAAVKTNGTLYTWGDNEFSKLGHGDTTARTIPTQVGTATNWRTVAVTDVYMLALKTNNTLYAWGNNTTGALGLGDTALRTTPTQVGTANNWVSIGHGNSFSFAIKQDGTMYSTGTNANGRLGLGDAAQEHTPTDMLVQ
ncbi:hypothetical protein A3C87_03645 [Candidatus Kaiserbacteria bacterium RIFCSPHIGHO2_02_FULL_49_34]|uniref:RCC1-like domain-containing protein n=1 Tax=Candidatus Kaiserbacteria bacterium RIFCSPHIGHO2_02_FULL_49_34 TaxID=1798491 RepID=A0A1F6DIH7_9BACT|nr:MAG: hypothetical protein A3C87_03645 [Candidatus Kaiserbacteria bacterium RIFCSPHIGHO2_02_FULL_49_34]